MLRVLLTPRWIVLTLLTAVAAGACVLLGQWQWHRAIGTMEAERASLAAVIPVTEAAPPGQPLPPSSIGRRVTAVGDLEIDRTVLVSGRYDGSGGTCDWVVAPLVLDDGRVVAVIRGFVASPTSPEVRAEAARPLEVLGVLQPFETFYAEAPIQPDGTLLAINDRVLRESWGEVDLVPGVLVLAEQVPAADDAPAPVPPTFGPPAASLPISNFFYAVQWWLFGVFALVMWARWWRLDSRKVASPS